MLVVPGEAVRTEEARAALPRTVPLEDAVFNVAHASLLMLGLATADWDLIVAGLHDRLHQPHRAHLYPRSAELVERARALGALGATISGAGPTVLVWTRVEQTGAHDRGAEARDGGLGGGDARPLRSLRVPMCESSDRAAVRAATRRAAPGARVRGG